MNIKFYFHDSCIFKRNEYTCRGGNSVKGVTIPKSVRVNYKKKKVDFKVAGKEESLATGLCV